MAMIIEELDRIKQSLKNKRGPFSIVTGQRMLPVGGAAVDSKELLTKDDFCNAFLYTALTRGLHDFNSYVSPAAGMEKIIDYSKKALEKCLMLKQDEAVICERAGGQECLAYPKYGFNLLGSAKGFEEAFGLPAYTSMDICMMLFYMTEYFEKGMELQPADIRESVKSELSRELKTLAEHVAQKEIPDAEFVNSIQRIKNDASAAMRNMINGAGSGEGEREETIAEKCLSRRLKGEAVFLGITEGVEGWARIIWKKNPQLLDFYKTCRLASVAGKLQNYDSNENLRFIWRKTGVPADFFNGKDFEWRTVKAENRDELKKALMESARSFIPDANNMSPAMEMWFWNAGNHWMSNTALKMWSSNDGNRWLSNSIPECWQDFNEYCSNPEYDGSLSWDKD